MYVRYAYIDPSNHPYVGKLQNYMECLGTVFGKSRKLPRSQVRQQGIPLGLWARLRDAAR